MKKILVTGAGGYIGRHVVKQLLDMGAVVIAADIHVEGVDKRAVTIERNIFDGSPHIFTELGSPDICLHMAWRDGFTHNSNAHMECLSDHIRVCRNLIEGGLKQLAVMGTQHEVGFYEGEVNEDTPCFPQSLYGIAKNSLRQALFQMYGESELTLQWLRAFYIYGDDKHNLSIFAKLLAAEEEGKTEFPFNSGKNKYDFILVEELARQIAMCVMQDTIKGIINCCSGTPISLADKVEDFIQVHKLNIRLAYNTFPDRTYDSPAIWGNADKIRLIMNMYHEIGLQ